MPTNKELQIQLEALITRVASLEATNADLKKELETIKTARSGSTWANTLFKSNVKPAVEMMNVVSAAKIEIKDQASRSQQICSVRTAAVKSRRRSQAQRRRYI